MRSVRSGVCLLGLILLAGCGSGDDVSDPSDELAVGSIVGTIDGTNWSTSTAIAIFASGRVVASGTGSQNLTFGFGVSATAPGTYSTGGSGNVSGLLAGAGNTVWEATAPGGSGTLTITSSAANEVAGTFSFTVVRTSGSGTPTTRTISNGRFRVRY